MSVRVVEFYVTTTTANATVASVVFNTPLRACVAVRLVDAYVEVAAPLTAASVGPVFVCDDVVSRNLQPDMVSEPVTLALGCVLPTTPGSTRSAPFDPDGGDVVVVARTAFTLDRLNLSIVDASGTPVQTSRAAFKIRVFHH